jgi:hypothetical protein
MKTFLACVIAAVTLGLPLSAIAQSPEARYCAALAEKYAGFLAATNLAHDPQTVSGRVGIQHCQAGNTAVGIALLETSLRNVGLDLPPRQAPTYIPVTHGHSKGG